MRPRSRVRRDLVAVAAVLGAAVVMYPGALLRGELFFERDLQFEWYPRLAELGRCLAQRAWPLWDPTVGFGQPLLGDPATQAAYPLSWPTLFVSVSHAYTLLVLVHLCLAAVGARRLAAGLGAGRTGACATAAAFVLSGPLQSALTLWHHFASACWMPLVLLGMRRCARAPGGRSIAALGACAGLQLLAGSADVCLMTWLLGGVLVASDAALRRRAWRASVPGAIVGAGLLATAIGAVVWLPASALASRSARHELPLEIRAAWSVPAAGLLRLAAPLDPTRVPFDPQAWQRLYDRAGGPFLNSIYLGLAALCLAVAAAGDPRARRRALTLLACGAAAVVMAMGPHGGLYTAAMTVAPPLRMLRFPSKALLVAALALALAAGLAVSAIERRRLSPLCARLAGVALFAAAAGSLLVSLRLSGSAEWAALASAAAAALLLLRLDQVDRRLAGAALACLLAVELIAVERPLNPTAPPAVVFEPPPVLRQLQLADAPRLYVYDYHTFPAVSERLLHRPDAYRVVAGASGVDPRVFAAWALHLYMPPRTGSLFGVLGSYEYDTLGLYPRDLNDLTYYLRVVEGSPVHLKLLRMGAVGQVLSLHASGLEDLRPVQSVPAAFPEPIRVWSVPGSLPRARLVGCARIADRAEAFRALASPDFQPDSEVLLPEPVPGAEGRCGEAGRVRVAAPGPDTLRVEAFADRSAFLVVADAWDPGWRVFVDGRPAPLLRANVGFRATPVPPGAHVVEMVYRPPQAVTGALLSLAGWGTALWLGLRRRARPRP